MHTIITIIEYVMLNHVINKKQNYICEVKILCSSM